MKKAVLVSTVAIFSMLSSPAVRAESDAVSKRLDALEKEISAVRRENAALRRIAGIRRENAKPNTANADRMGAPAKHDAFGAYAADLPTAYKAPVAANLGRLQVWGEGGAVLSGGDPSYSFYDRPNSPTSLSSAPDRFTLKPKVGWEAAAGFDYRFENSLWHASAQFRYGEGQKSVSDAIALGSAGFLITANPVADMKETHWLADAAFGRDVIGWGANAMQLKFGLRIAELRSSTSDANAVFASLGPSFLQGTSFSNQESKFFGAGPRIGIDGSVPLGSGWALDYLSDAAVLFGNQDYQLERGTRNVATSIVGATIAPPTFIAKQDFKTVFNADIQVGVSYWIMPSVKVSASYRLDAYFNVFNGLSIANDPTKLQTSDRYIHGPHVGVSATF